MGPWLSAPCLQRSQSLAGRGPGLGDRPQEQERPTSTHLQRTLPANEETGLWAPPGTAHPSFVLPPGGQARKRPRLFTGRRESVIGIIWMRFTVWHHGLPQAGQGNQRPRCQWESPVRQLASEGALRTVALFLLSLPVQPGQYQPLLRRQSLEPGHPLQAWGAKQGRAGLQTGGNLLLHGLFVSWREPGSL